MKASHIMQQRIAKTTNITQLFHTQVTAIAGEEAVTGIQLYNNQTNTHYEQPVQGVFIAIGHTPNTHLFTKYLDLDAHGYIKTIPGTTSTNIPGIFAAGDVQDPIYRQAITAAGTGCMAALAAEKFLTEANLS